MKLTEKQMRLAALTMELDLKTREYKKLCEEFDKLKSNYENQNGLNFASLYEKFKLNQNELNDIISKLKKLKEEN